MTVFDLNQLLPKHIASPKSVERVHSPFQLAILAKHRDDREPFIVEGVAGCAKTYTITQMSREGGNVLLLAFNKSIADELKSRVSSNCTVKTMNALGHNMVRNKIPGSVFNGTGKTWKYLRGKLSQENLDLYGPHIRAAISIAKGAALGITREATREDFELIIDSFAVNIEPDTLPWVANIAYNAFIDLATDLNEFDFDDQLYFPIAQGWTFPKFDEVMIDEAQDLNTIQHLHLEALASRGARIIAVGDRRQAIYGFRGALSDSMDLLRDRFAMAELPLSITYRCSRAITAKAQSIVPQILPREDAPEGEILELTDYPSLDSYVTGDLIICRNNAPIFELALSFLRERRPCRVMSNFLEQIESFILSFKASSPAILMQRLDPWYEKQRANCEGYNAIKMDSIQDRYDVVKGFCQEYPTIQAIRSAIKSLAFSATGPRISTIHKAKGLEADTVYLLRFDLLPSARASTQEQLIQEENLRYVAITRARNRLVILPRGE